MRRLLSLFALLLFIGNPLQAQTAADGPELARLLNEFLAGAGRNDAAVHDRFWAPDLIYTRSAGTRTNKEDLMKGVRAAPAAKPGDPVTVYTAEDVRIQQYGNAAVVAFKLVGTAARTDGTTSVSYHLNTGTFVKRGGKWQVVAWQATAIPPPAPAVKAPVGSAASISTPLAGTSTPMITRADGGGSLTYIKGPRGGCYYINSQGKKMYVDKGRCN